MNSLERLVARMSGLEVDRIPNLNIFMFFAAKYAGIPYGDFILKPECKVEANIKCHNDFMVDAVTVMSDPYTEAEGFGCEIEYPENDHPRCINHIINDYDDIKKLKLHKIEDCRRMSNTVEVVSLYKSKLGNSVPIIGWVEGPVAEFCDIYDINNAMTDLLVVPDFACEVMDICTDQAILFAREQIKAGAHIIGMGDAAASIVGNRIYEEMILPREIKIVNEIHKMGAMCKLHICGNIAPLLENIKKIGADIVDVDHMVDFKFASEVLAGVSCVSGNLDPVGMIMNSTPEIISARTKELISKTSSTTIISSGCEIPKDTSHENIIAMVNACRL